MAKETEQENRERKFEPGKREKDPARAPHAKDIGRKGQNIAQNTRNPGYQQDR